MTSWKGEASPRTGILLLSSGILLIIHGLKTLNVLGFFPPYYSTTQSQHDTLPLEVFIPLAIVPYILFRIVQYISLELYLSN
jgi:hypothetical protein